ncbi:hypothetical protein BGZ76_006032 [Entomortierella beljakovae]|nr:hypothetical protein BGZ76_006032 [Entomortierella beljakovae]
MLGRLHTKSWRTVVYSIVLVAISTVALGAVQYMDLPPSRIALCPDAYLIEFTSEPGSPGAATELSTFLANISALKSVTIRQKLTTLIHGVSVHVKDPIDLSIIMGWDSIKRVTQLTIVSPPKQVQPEQVQPKQNPLVTSSLEMTGASRVHSELGIKGRGIKVGVIDTGVDYTHPALGGCFGKGCRVFVGYDFVGDKYNGSNTPNPKGDPKDCKGHGTHVAGIIGASNEIITGVAPDVQLGAYKIMGCDGNTNDDIILAALERAIADGMDVINISLGETNGWTNNPVARAISKVKKFGVMVTVSHGNDNAMGLFSSNYIGVGKSVLTVASLMNSKTVGRFFSISPDPNIAAMNGTDLSLGCEPFKGDLTGKILLVSRGICTFELKGRHAVDRGAAGIIFANNVPGSPATPAMGPLTIPAPSITQEAGRKLFEKLKSNSKELGEYTSGDVTVFFSPDEEFISNPAAKSVSTFSSFGINNDLFIKPDIGAPGENIFSTWVMKNGSYNTISGTSMSSPHVAGALALTLQHYRNLTGSKARVKWSVVERIFNIFHNTAEPSHVFMNHTPFDVLTPPKAPPSDAENTIIESIAKQGSGLLNVYRAITSLRSLFSISKNDGELDESTEESVPPIQSTLVLPAVLELNDTDNPFYQRQKFTIYNYGDETVQYKLSCLPAETLHEISIESKQVKLDNHDIYHPGQNTSSGDDILYVKADPKVTFNSDTVSVPARGKRKVTVKISPPEGLSDDEHWIYSGFIVIQANAASDSRVYFGDPILSSDAIHVPFAGVRGSMKSLPIFLRPTPEETTVNKNLELCGTIKVQQPLLPGQTDPSYSFVDNNIPAIYFCIENPTEFLVLDLITGTPTNEDPLNPDYLMLGRIASSKYVPRPPSTGVVSIAAWDGTIEFNSTNKLSSESGEELIQRRPGIDILYGMQPETPKFDGVESQSSSNSGSYMRTLAQRDIKTTNPNQGIDANPPTEEDPNNVKILSTKPQKGETRVKVPNGRYRLRLRALRMLALPSKSTSRIEVLIPSENLDAYNDSDNDNTNENQEQHKDENSKYAKDGNLDSSHHSSPKQIISSTQSTATTTHSKLDDVSSMTRGHHRLATRRRSTKRGVITRARASRNSGFFSDDEDDIEEPRLQHHLESVVSVEQPWSTSGFDIFKEVAGRVQKGPNKKDYKSIFGSTTLGDNTSSAIGTTESELSMVDDSLMDISQSTQQKWEREQSTHDNLDDQSSLMFSRLSLTPPPMMFDLEEGFEAMETPWQMVFDSSLSHSAFDPNPRIKIAQLTNADLAFADKELHLEGDLPDINNEGDDEEDDDPFGFSKAERQLVKTKNRRPKLLAINEINHRFFMATRAVIGSDFIANNSTLNNNQTRSSNSTPSRNIQERLAARRRGDMKSKGKAVDYQNSPSSTPGVTSNTRAMDAEGNVDEDIQKAMQLSRGLDIENGEGCSTSGTTLLSTTMSTSSKETANDELDSTTLAELSSTQDDNFIANIRSSRRISRMYGKATIQDTQVSSEELDASPSNSPKSDGDISKQLPTTPPSKPRFSYSMGDLSPIVIQTTPKKKPEAGMPLSLDSSSTSGKNRRFKQYLLTEQLEALLPRPRRLKAAGGSMSRKTNSNVNSRRTVNVSDDEISSEEEDEPLVRGSLRKRPAAAAADAQLPSKKRQTVTKSRIPVPTRTRAPQKTKDSTISITIPSNPSNNNKEKELSKDIDKSGWTEAQLQAHEERIKYFQQIDDFELDVETL